MSQRQAKKLRQLYGRDLQGHAQAQANLIEQQIKEFSEKVEDILRPAPKLIPNFIWVSLQRIFLNI